MGQAQPNSQTRGTRTSGTLLERLRDAADPMAWEEFASHYMLFMRAVAMQHGCSEQTAEDVVQDVVAAAIEKEHVFRYDPARGRFHAWLRILVRQRVAAVRRGRRHERRRPGGAEDPWPLEPESPDGRPEEALDAAFESQLLLALLDVVRQEVSGETYQAFELTALRGLEGAAAARLTGLSRNAVFQARKRVMGRLRELGAPYREEGELDARLKEALKLYPSPAAERSMTAKIETTLRTRLGAPG